MENISEVAKYFLLKESMTHKKLQKLCYYAQAWHLANFQTPLVLSQFEAWVHGPVAPDLYRIYGKWGWCPISQLPNDTPQFSSPRTESFLNQVYGIYGGYSGDQLEAISRQEEPWRNARDGYSGDAYCRETIPQGEMMRYYGGRLARERSA